MKPPSKPHWFTHLSDGPARAAAESLLSDLRRWDRERRATEGCNCNKNRVSTNSHMNSEMIWFDQQEVGIEHGRVADSSMNDACLIADEQRWVTSSANDDHLDRVKQSQVGGAIQPDGLPKTQSTLIELKNKINNQIVGWNSMTDIAGEVGGGSKSNHIWCIWWTMDMGQND